MVLDASDERCWSVTHLIKRKIEKDPQTFRIPQPTDSAFYRLLFACVTLREPFSLDSELPHPSESNKKAHSLTTVRWLPSSYGSSQISVSEIAAQGYAILAPVKDSNQLVAMFTLMWPPVYFYCVFKVWHFILVL